MRDEILNPLFSDISSIKGVGSKTLKLLTKLIDSSKIRDLIFHLPSNIIDRSYYPKLSDAQIGRICTLKVKVIEHMVPKNKHQPYKVLVNDGTENLTLIFFKIYADSIAKNLPVGAFRYISGKLEKFNNTLQMTHPDYIVQEQDVAKLPKFETVAAFATKSYEN